jgi:hypothetical protein
MGSGHKGGGMMRRTGLYAGGKTLTMDSLT